MAEDEMAGWHHLLDGHEFEQALGVGVGHVAVHGVTKRWTQLSNSAPKEERSVLECS